LPENVHQNGRLVVIQRSTRFGLPVAPDNSRYCRWRWNRPASSALPRQNYYRESVEQRVGQG